MQASPLLSRTRRPVQVRTWAWWQLPPALRWYVAGVVVAGAAVIAATAATTHWRAHDLGMFGLMALCGAISIASTPRIAYTHPGGLTRDFTAIWVLPIAILLAPAYSAIVSIPFLMIIQYFVHRGVAYRRVFTAASVSIGYSAASWAFRLIPPSLAGGRIGSGMHAFTWVLAVAACYMIASRVQHFLIVGAIKISNPSVRILSMEWNREALQGLFVEIDLGVVITLAIAISPALVVVAMPTVFLVRRFLVHPILIAQSRVDAKTGLLNVSTWEREAEAELSRSVRSRNAVALAIMDIDHFKRVNDTYGHLVGDRVLRAVSDMIKAQSRDYDKAGRFGGEEFVLLLAQADEDDACRIAERLRAHISAMAVPIDDRPDSPVVRITISIGVSAMDYGMSRELTDLLTAADSALYRAKQTGRNRVCVSAPVQAGQLAAEIASQIGFVAEDPAGASLCPAKSL